MSNARLYKALKNLAPYLAIAIGSVSCLDDHMPRERSLAQNFDDNWREINELASEFRESGFCGVSSGAIGQYAMVYDCGAEKERAAKNAIGASFQSLLETANVHEVYGRGEQIIIVTDAPNDFQGIIYQAVYINVVHKREFPDCTSISMSNTSEGRCAIAMRGDWYLVYSWTVEKSQGR